MNRTDRALVTGLSGLVGALLLYFAGVPLLGLLIDDWGRFLVGVTVMVGLYGLAIVVGVAWIIRGRSERP